MKYKFHTFSIFFFSCVLVFSFSMCKHQGKGKCIYQVESKSENLTDAEEALLEKIYRTRLTAIEIEDGDIVIKKDNAKNIIDVEISEISNYGPDITDRIANLLQSTGHLAFWETFSNQEIEPSLQKCFMDDSVKKREFNDFFAFEPPMDYDRKRRDCKFGLVDRHDTSRVTFILDSLVSTRQLPPFFRFAWTAKPPEANRKWLFGLILLKACPQGTATIDKPVLTDARWVLSRFGTGPEISLTMDEPTSLLWSRMTKANIGKSIAIVLDGSVFTYPTVQSEITGGISSITGNFTVNEAKELAAVLNSTDLPYPMTIVAQNRVP